MSHHQNGKKTSLYCFKPLCWWSFVTAAIGSYYAFFQSIIVCLSNPSEYELHELGSLSVLFTFSPRPWWWTNKSESWKSLRNHLGHLIFFFILSLYPIPRFLFFFKQLYWGRICPQFFVCFLGCVLGLFFLPHHMACGILVAWPEIEPPAFEVRSLNYRTLREVLATSLFLNERKLRPSEGQSLA